MLSPMTVAQHSNYILNYESAIAALKNRPQDRNLQHKAVLSLARSGALDFAIAEYNRFGLNKVRQDEDIMALNDIFEVLETQLYGMLRTRRKNMRPRFNPLKVIIPA